MYVSLRNAPHYISSLIPFTGNSLRGEWYPAGWGIPRGLLNDSERNLIDGLDGRYPTYVVFSYSTPIAYCQDGAWYVVQQKFSVTTSKHQGVVRRSLPVHTVKIGA